MAALTWSRAAKRDLLEIYKFLASTSMRQADRVFERVKELTDLLKTHPRVGSRRDWLAPDVRVLVSGPYLIFYRLIPDKPEAAVNKVKVLRVLDGRRDLYAVRHTIQ